MWQTKPTYHEAVAALDESVEDADAVDALYGDLKNSKTSVECDLQQMLQRKDVRSIRFLDEQLRVQNLRILTLTGKREDWLLVIDTSAQIGIELESIHRLRHMPPVSSEDPLGAADAPSVGEEQAFRGSCIPVRET